MIKKVQAFASSDQVLIVWQVDTMIPNCAGFALRRWVDGKDCGWLDTWVGFENEQAPPPGTHEPSTQWPVQKTSWIDYLAPETGNIEYEVVPVLLGADGKVSPVDETQAKRSQPVSLDQREAPITAWFNRGTISAQWVARAIGKVPSPSKTLAEKIDTIGDPIRNQLAGRARERLVAHLDAAIADPKRQIYAALFELNDCELVAKLEKLGGQAHVVLGNSDGGDTANVHSTDDSATRLLQAGVDLTRRKIAPARFAHNKFVVFCAADGTPERVWTGSINWTETGVCTQNSNGLDIADPVAAKAYFGHWQALRKAGTELITENASHAFNVKIGGKTSSCDVWFTPIVDSVDLEEARSLISAATSGIVFLMLNPGPSGLLGPIIERLSPLDAHYNPDLYVRGVLNNFPSREKTTSGDMISLLTSEGKRQDFSDDDLRDVLKPAGIKKSASWWQKELANTGKFMVAVHSKVIVIDPSGPSPVVMTGSHNFSARASEKNDDNLVIVRGARALTQAYAVNVMNVYNEYRWRAWRNTAEGMKDNGLKASDTWLSDRIDGKWGERERRFWMGS